MIQYAKTSEKNCYSNEIVSLKYGDKNIFVQNYNTYVILCIISQTEFNSYRPLSVSFNQLYTSFPRYFTHIFFRFSMFFFY